jgi:transcription-repair coupling factor (superfamily II helicase)
LSKAAIYSQYDRNPKIAELAESLAKRDSKVHLKGLLGSSLSFVIKSVFEKTGLPFLVVFNDKEEAAYYLNDLELLVGENDVLFYPGSYRRHYQLEETDNANILLRAEVLNRINSRKKPAVIVTYADAVFEKVITRKELEKNTLKVSVGDQISIDLFNDVLHDYVFRRVVFIT